ncbi:unnamed protein product [Hanseniaspora opuntiae]
MSNDINNIFKLNNIEENKRHSPFIFQNIPTFADAQQLNSAEIVSLTLPYLQHPKKSLSSSIPYNPNYPIQNINLSARNSFNPQQQLILNSLDSGKDMDKLPNPLFSSNSLNLNPPLLTGSSNFSPMDIHNPLMRNSFMIPTYNAVYDNFSGKQFASFSPLNSTIKPSSTRDDEKEFEEFKRTQSEKNNKALKKTTKKVEKKKKTKHSPNKRKSSIRKSISATGAIKPQLLEIDNNMFYNNIAESSIFETLDFNHVDAQKANHLFPPLSSTEYNESQNTVDPNNMFAHKATASVYSPVTPGIASNYKNNDYASLMNGGHDVTVNSKGQDHGYHQNFVLENDPKNESDMNFINFLALKEKINESANKVTKKSTTTKKKKANVDTNLYLDFESSTKNKDAVSIKKDPQKTVKRGRKPKPIQIKDQKKPSKPPVKREITTDDNVAPQYINFDNSHDAASKVLTESTRKVIDEIKHNALNGGGSIVNFSPLLEIPNYQPHLHNSGSTLPVSLSSARQFPKSSVHNYYGMLPNGFNGERSYGVLDTAEHMMDIKKISPFDSITGSSMNSSVSTFNNSLKTH